MAHYAALDSSNVVKLIFVGRDEDDLIDGVNSWEDYYSTDGYIAKRTSYNTYGGAHLSGGTPFRKNYAGIGYTYDAERDAFIAPKPFDSWLLDEATCLWKAPVAYPTDGLTYKWNETETDWELQDFSEGA